jgi:hypothetical protein
VPNVRQVARARWDHVVLLVDLTVCRAVRSVVEPSGESPKLGNKSVTVKCMTCGAPARPASMCARCGFYNAPGMGRARGEGPGELTRSQPKRMRGKRHRGS